MQQIVHGGRVLAVAAEAKTVSDLLGFLENDVYNGRYVLDRAAITDKLDQIIALTQADGLARGIQLCAKGESVGPSSECVGEDCTAKQNLCPSGSRLAGTIEVHPDVSPSSLKVIHRRRSGGHGADCYIGALGESRLTRQATREELERMAKELGEAQRGAPEEAMLQVQFTMGGGVLNPVVEHVGDLTHRMTHMLPHGESLYEIVRDKVERQLKRLEHPYGFERELDENIRSNARYYGISEEEYRARLTAALQRYADAHRQLPVFNTVQRLARDAAVAIGEQRWDDARRLLRQLYDEYLSDRQTYERAVREVEGLLGYCAAEAAKEAPVHVWYTPTGG